MSEEFILTPFHHKPLLKTAKIIVWSVALIFFFPALLSLSLKPFYDVFLTLREAMHLFH
jgi:hypothetical protein